jgi:hypothetical protein
MRAGRHIVQHLRQTPLKQLAKLNHCDNWIRLGPDPPASCPASVDAASNAPARLPDRKKADGSVSIGVAALVGFAATRTNAKGHASLKYATAPSNNKLGHNVKIHSLRLQ